MSLASFTNPNNLLPSICDYCYSTNGSFRICMGNTSHTLCDLCRVQFGEKCPMCRSDYFPENAEAAENVPITPVSPNRFMIPNFGGRLTRAPANPARRAEDNFFRAVWDALAESLFLPCFRFGSTSRNFGAILLRFVKRAGRSALLLLSPDERNMKIFPISVALFLAFVGFHAVTSLNGKNGSASASGKAGLRLASSSIRKAGKGGRFSFNFHQRSWF